MSTSPFNTDEPIAFFITWTTYGTWLPGDERGWRRRNAKGVNAPRALYKQMATADMKETAFTLSPSHRDLVEQTIAKHCEIRN